MTEKQTALLLKLEWWQKIIKWTRLVIHKKTELEIDLHFLSCWTFAIWNK